MRPLDSYNKTWLGVIAVAVVAVLIGALLLVKELGIGYRQFTGEFLQAAALRPGNIVAVADFPMPMEPVRPIRRIAQPCAMNCILCSR